MLVITTATGGIGSQVLRGLLETALCVPEAANRQTHHGRQPLVDTRRAPGGSPGAGDSRTARTTHPTTFRNWCEQVREPIVLG
ncbi:hypothetical protein [Streptomyces sp. NPDC059788]|uniref:hypothetical protein n=1 Tax=Streptomyces sp. NPDC059788 TaxID=3346948 RepID=UPI003657AF25